MAGRGREDVGEDVGVVECGLYAIVCVGETSVLRSVASFFCSSPAGWYCAACVPAAILCLTRCIHDAIVGATVARAGCADNHTTRERLDTARKTPK